MPPKGCSSKMLRKDTNACCFSHLHSAKKTIRVTANQRLRIFAEWHTHTHTHTHRPAKCQVWPMTMFGLSTELCVLLLLNLTCDPYSRKTVLVLISRRIPRKTTCSSYRRIRGSSRPNASVWFSPPVNRSCWGTTWPRMTRTTCSLWSYETGPCFPPCGS